MSKRLTATVAAAVATAVATAVAVMAVVAAVAVAGPSSSQPARYCQCMHAGMLPGSADN